jgi:hypothetical protein
MQAPLALNWNILEIVCIYVRAHALSHKCLQSFPNLGGGVTRAFFGWALLNKTKVPYFYREKKILTKAWATSVI